MPIFIFIFIISLLFSSCNLTANLLDSDINSKTTTNNVEVNTKSTETLSDPSVKILVVDCANCGGAEAAGQIKSQLVNEATIETIEASSEEGQRLITKFTATSLPLIIFNKNIINTSIKDSLPKIATENDNEFMLNIDKAGFQVNSQSIN